MFTNILKICNYVSQCFLGIVATMGSTWQQNRRATLQILRDYGFGKTGMENTIKEEAAGLADIIRFPFFLSSCVKIGCYSFSIFKLSK
jgi:hypothetical protein